MVCGVLGDGAKLVRAFGVFTDRSTASMDDVALVFPDFKAGVLEPLGEFRTRGMGDHVLVMNYSV